MIISHALLAVIGAGAVVLGAGIYFASIEAGIIYTGIVGIGGLVFKYRLSR